MKRHRLAIVGLGMAVTPHAKSLIDLAERVEVVAAFTPSAKRRSEFAARFPFPLCESLDAVMSDRTIDAVMILTPPNTHLEIVRQAAAAGKHVLLEKPLEITTARAVEMVETCERAGVTLGIVLQHRFRPAGLKLRELIAAGELGTLAECSTTIRLWRPQAYYDVPGRGTRARDGGGVLMSQGIHTLDLMLSLVGPVREVSSFATTTGVHRMETEDLVCAAAKFANGAIGTIMATTASYPGFPERIEITGDKATALMAGTGLEVAHHDGRVTRFEPDPSAGGTGADPMAFPHDWHRAVIADFFDAVEQGRAPAISGREALKVHRLIDALLEAAESGHRTVVKA
ncbi:Gfo/Idh/MocA family oxidoreductase [Xanthobacteraceae bacterium Astr-EGSB]|uniref:Gfo/Idh/MocA family protein n=1 Tax=Astrobacterium formosum TaxID=3069710 RepID=UPI0027B0B5E2|nr:Gfo/Idh/MocA family oxidoreductase [Xanthobacteraceae bacterium Astr-EGSB]